MGDKSKKVEVLRPWNYVKTNMTTTDKRLNLVAVYARSCDILDEDGTPRHIIEYVSESEVPKVIRKR